MNNPLISVIIPLYRGEELLEQTLQSTLDQTFQDFEIVLIDNNALTRTREIARKWASRYPEMIRIIHEPVQGVCSARNTGIRESRGTYIAFLDEDDLMLPQRLEKQLAIIENRQDISLVTSLYDLISHDGKETFSKRLNTFDKASIETANLIKDIFDDKHSYRHLDSFHLTYPSTYFFRKNQALEAGLFSTQLNPGFTEDIEFQIRMFELGDFVQVPETLALYRLTSPEYEQKRPSDRFERNFLSQHSFIKLLYERFGNRGKRAQSAINKLRWRYLKKLGTWLFSYRDGDKLGRKFLRAALYANPMSYEVWKFFLKSFFPQKMHPRLFWFPKFKAKGVGDFGIALEKMDLRWPPSSKQANRSEN